MTYGKDSDNNDVPRKTLTITKRHSIKTVYPPYGIPTIPRMTPTSDTNREYRGYIGYKPRAAKTNSA